MGTLVNPLVEVALLVRNLTKQNQWQIPSIRCYDTLKHRLGHQIQSSTDSYRRFINAPHLFLLRWNIFLRSILRHSSRICIVVSPPFVGAIARCPPTSSARWFAWSASVVGAGAVWPSTASASIGRTRPMAMPFPHQVSPNLLAPAPGDDHCKKRNLWEKRHHVLFNQSKAASTLSNKSVVKTVKPHNREAGFLKWEVWKVCKWGREYSIGILLKSRMMVNKL